MLTPSSPSHLFVYGTLRHADGRSQHPLLESATFVGFGTLPGRLYALGAYPGAVFDPIADTTIHGEIYLLHDPPATLAGLDRYEACTDADPRPHEYVRSWQTVRLATGHGVAAWVYLYYWPVDERQRIATGDWGGARRGEAPPAGT